jgi:hypothetical protein
VNLALPEFSIINSQNGRQPLRGLVSGADSRSNEVSTGSGPGSPRGQPAWGGGSDRVILGLSLSQFALFRVISWIGLRLCVLPRKIRTRSTKTHEKHQLVNASIPSPLICVICDMKNKPTAARLRIVLEQPTAGVDFGLREGHGSNYDGPKPGVILLQ